MSTTALARDDGPEAVIEVWSYNPIDWDGRVDRWSLVLDLYGMHDAEGDPRI